MSRGAEVSLFEQGVLEVGIPEVAVVKDGAGQVRVGKIHLAQP